MIGRSIGHYRILEKLGAGGMGEVYRAEDTTLKRHVALKILPATLASSRERLERFQREAETLAALDHPNVVTIHSVEQADDVHFLTMQLVEGRTLADLIPSGGLSLERTFGIAVPLADALAAAHEKGVVHRDLKPANIMITDEGPLKILDFGLAKLRQPSLSPEASQLPTEAMTQEGLVLGTVPYMSPEQVQGEPVDHRTDIFSLGVLLYEMVSGLRPFQGPNSAALVSSILRDTPVPVTEIRDELPEEMGRIIRQCLEKDPERRFQSAKDVRNELEVLQRGASSGSMPVRSEPAVPEALPTPKSWRLAALSVAALVAVVGGLYLATTQLPRAASKTPQVASLAVLPLDNLSGDPEQEYIVDGLHETLITDLSRLEGLSKVVARGSVLAFKQDRPPITEIGRLLGVDAVVTGAVQRFRDRISVSAQLTLTDNEETLWADRYERELDDLFALQSEISGAIARGVVGELTPGDQEALTPARPVEPEAYRTYLKARYLLSSKPSEENVWKTVELFRKSIEIDPLYAPAYAGLATSFFTLGSSGMNLLPPREALPKARAAAIQALELDDRLAEAHAVLAYVLGFYDWDWESAAHRYERALELNPNDAMVRIWYSQLLDYGLAKEEEGIAEASRARELDPLNPFAEVNLVFRLYTARRYEEAEDRVRQALEIFPELWVSHWVLGLIQVQRGLYPEAMTSFDQALRLSGRNSNVVSTAGYTHGVAGKPEDALAVIEELDSLAENSYVSPSLWVPPHLGLGDLDSALDWVERSYEERSDWLFIFARDPMFDKLRDHPRFQEILEKSKRSD